MGKVKLWWHPASAPSRAVWWYLVSSGLDHEVVQVDIAKGDHRTKEFLAMNPLGQVPVIEHTRDAGGVLALSESTAILEYLRCVKEHEETGEFSAKLAEYFALHHSLVRDLSVVCVGPILASDASERDEAMQQGLERVEPILTRFSKLLAFQKFVLSEELSLADFLFATELDQLHAFGLLEETHPHLVAYLERVSEEKGYAESYKAYCAELRVHLPDFKD
eukprot:TRINITY_DN22729_c0_g1_i1.p1 TRINITY_DN22729_c0_g1~~TRINITY_DN22729_c0_g1_i1.p1  ORF type:complete len:255 (+),score=95.67 TRINITY_DN22729_c0_g1_i1:107-766(+)